MTHTTALSLVLFASLGMTACTVDAPTPEDFTYSFLDGLPGGTSANSFAVAKQPLEATIAIEFRDSMHGTDELNPKISAVPLTIDGVQLGRPASDGTMEWRSVGSKPIDLDLMTLADGDTTRIAYGPVPEGEYSAIAVAVTSSRLETGDGDVHELGLPGPVLVIHQDFYLAFDDEYEFVIQFGGLRGIESGEDDAWRTDPNVSFYVEHE